MIKGNERCHLRFWGSIEKKSFELLGTKDQDFWFNSFEERQRLKDKLNAFAKKHDLGMVTSEHEGYLCECRTIAVMDLVYKGARHKYRNDFGYGYPEDSARFMFFDGNYACDCNLSLFLSRQGVDIEEMGCGYEIAIENFKVEFETKEDYEVRHRS